MNLNRVLQILNNTYFALDYFEYFNPKMESILLVYD